VTSSEISDLDLIQKISQGDKKSFESLFLRYSKIVLGVCMRITKSKTKSEDISQEVWMTVLKKSVDFEPRHANSARGWILMIARNAAISDLRSSKWEIPEADPTVLDSEISLKDFEGLFEQKSDIQLVRKAIDELQDEYRIILTMYLSEELELGQIANELEITYNHAKVLLFRSRESLKEVLLAKGRSM
jgi:RNA polymerase sigma-70 factor (ECF subfamily)